MDFVILGVRRPFFHDLIFSEDIIPWALNSTGGMGRGLRYDVRNQAAGLLVEPPSGMSRKSAAVEP
jgi:hypothetical protein